MLTRVHTIITQGLKPITIDVEVNSVSGIPQIVIIGLVNTAVREAKDRIITALKHLGIRLKARRTIISLTPADIKKSGSSFDLAIAVGLISLYKKVYLPLEKAVFIGEISLDGSVKSVNNCLIKVLGAKQLGYTTVVIPFGNLEDVSLVDGITIFGIKQLTALITNTNDQLFKPSNPPQNKIRQKLPDVKLVGQHEVVRAITIAIAGKHHLHIIGPPGVGKTTSANLARNLLPNLTVKEALEVLSIKSLLEINNATENLYQAPFRSPHHSIRLKKMLGTSNDFKPGELSLAHNGVLFLDELPLFSSEVLNGLRKPLDDKKIFLSSQKNEVEMPCKLLILAASNPCPCGYWQTGVRSCGCSAGERTHYSKKLSGPLLDRFDLHVGISSLKNSEYQQTDSSNLINVLQEQIQSAKNIQKNRYQNSNINNSDLTISKIKRYCIIELQAKEFLTKAILALNLSTRAYEKIVAVSQTIADLESSKIITQTHLAEALNYRFEHSWSSNLPN